MKVRALKKFEALRDLERTKIQGKDVYPKEGEVWETSEERAKYLLSHGVIEIVEEVKEAKIETINEDNVIKKLEEAQEEILKDELVETIPVVDKNNVIVDRVVKEKPKKATKKKTSKK